VQTRYKLADGELSVSIEPENLEVLTSSTSLEVVLRNLLDNAVKYSDRPAAVRLETRLLPQNRVRLTVLDHGIGIAPEHLSRVFDRFYRVPDENVSARRGTGLGLYVASALVRNLGGQLQASSAGHGTGTTMWFEIPALNDVEERA
jgi:signal transduction histidine kinase